MRAQERLAKAHSVWMDDFSMPNRFVDGMFAADPHLAQDIEDGAALRRLREALPENTYFEVESPLDGFGWDITIESIYGGPSVAQAEGSTLAQAADACREAIEAQR